MGFNLFESVTKAYNDAEAGMMGEKWLAEVKDVSGNWKDLDGWKDQYEPKAPPPEEPAPPKEDSEMVKAAKSAAQVKAIEMGVQMIQENIVFQLMTILMECSCKVVGTCIELSSKDPSNPLREQLLPFLKAFQVVLMSYRFDPTGTGETNKFRYIRKAACGDLTNVAYELYSNDKTPTIFMEELTGALGEKQKHNIRAIMMDKMDEIANDASQGLDPESLAKVKELFGEGRDNVFFQFLSFMAVSKLDVVRIHILALMEEFMHSLEDEMKEQGDKKSKDEVKDGMFAFAESKYQESKTKVEGEVSTYTEMLKTMLLSGGPMSPPTTTDEATNA